MHGTTQGSVEKALAGEYELSFSETLKSAWSGTEGVKLTFIGSLFVYLVILMIATAVFSMILGVNLQEQEASSGSIIAQVGVDLLTMPIAMPMMVALMMMGIRHVNNRPVQISNLFDYYVVVWPLVFLSIAIYLCVVAGFLLLVLPGIYLSVAYAFAYPLMVDKKMGIWEAMETSRKAVTAHWFTVFGILLGVSLITLISAIPLGIGLIWTLPMGYIVYGILYTTIFGFSNEMETETTAESDGDW